MSSHKKRKGQDWERCTECKCMILCQDQSKHVKVCNFISGDEQIAQSMMRSDESTRHCYVKKTRCFVRCCKNAPNTIIGNEKLSDKHQDFFVTLPLIVMKLCGIKICSLVLLTNADGDQLIRSVAPSGHIGNDVGMYAKTLSNFNVKSGDFITVEPFLGLKRPAKKLLLRSITDTPITASPSIMIETLKTQECEKYFGVGNKLTFRYLGICYEFSVVQVMGNSDEIKKKSFTNSSKELVNKRSHIFTSTPVKPALPVFNEAEDESAFYYVTDSTNILIEDSDCIANKRIMPCSSLVGLDKEMSILQQLVKQSITQNVSLGILISGPAGIGKSALVKAIAEENKSHHFISIDDSAESVSAMLKIFGEARENSPSILLIENIDQLCPNRVDIINVHQLQLAAKLMIEIRKIHNYNTPIVVIATVRNLNDLDQTLRRPQQFDYEIELNVPNAEQNKEILQKILMPFNHSITEEELLQLSEMTLGFTALTIKSLINKAYKKKRQNVDSSNIELNIEDLKDVARSVVPHTNDGLNFEVPNTYWSDIGGYKNVKEKLIQAVQWPLKYPETYERLGISFSKGILLYGPSGCGKKSLAEAAATESRFNFIRISSNDVSMKYVGKSEEAIKNLFQAAKRTAPCIIFFDKIECLASARGGIGTGGRVENRVLGQLLKAIEDVRLCMVIVIGATTSPHLVDKALLRPGRLDKKIHVPVPDSSDRREIFNVWLKKMKVESDVVDKELIRRTEKYSGANIKGVCGGALRKALYDKFALSNSLHESKLTGSTAILLEHFYAGLENCTSSVSDYEISMCEKFESKPVTKSN